MRFLKGILQFFFRKQTNILSAATVIMITVFLSRLLGLFRDRLLVTYFSKETLGIYLAAFRIPNLLFELLVIGALSTAFIPVFTGYLSEKNEEEGLRMTSFLINIASSIVLVFATILIIFAVPLSKILAPGFTPDEITQMALFTRIILIGQVIPLVIGNFFTGVLQSFQRFIVPALAPVCYNLGILAGIVFLTPQWGLLGAVFGVLIGAFLFMLVQIPFVLQLGYVPRFGFGLDHAGVRKVLKLTIPRTIGLAATQIDATVDLVLATLLGSGSVTVFYFAQNLQQLPIGLFGATVAQAALPPLSTAVAQKNNKHFEQLLLASYHQILFFIIPFSVLLFVLRIPIVRLVFGAARFDWQGTILTSQTLAFFTISLFAQSLVQLFVRAFYALHDTKTPVIIGIVAMLINSVVSIIFIQFFHFGVWSLALSASFASIVNFLSLLVCLDRRISLNRHSLFVPPLKMMAAAGIAMIAAYIPIKLFDQLVFDTTRTIELFILTVIATLSCLATYFFFAWFFAIEEVATFINLVKRVRNVRQLMFSHSDELTTSAESAVT